MPDAAYDKLHAINIAFGQLIRGQLTQEQYASRLAEITRGHIPKDSAYNKDDGGAFEELGKRAAGNISAG